ncbi:MAG: hypothetical protein EWV75_10930 [Microcystis wesenbergii Mw_QC_S_20081001_S30D]|uniref:Uncharacterized protein n=2 Tax=Microcystis TaxID=1125 RepID=A0A552JLI4_9CHRO|nr:MAG: hypothetical protein EWV75_10930 [Microcystis wesenbergii Mw_QC_S_20081001_S30D]
MLSPHDKLKNASFLGAFLFIRLKKPMTIITKADKKVGCGVWGVGCGVWGVGGALRARCGGRINKNNLLNTDF